MSAWCHISVSQEVCMINTKPNIKPMQTNRVLDLIKEFEIFSYLDDIDTKRLANMIVAQKVKNHYLIYKEGDKSDLVYFLVKGTVKIWKSSDNNKEVIKSILHPKTMFGEQCIFGEDNRIDYAEAVEADTIFFTISRAELLTFMEVNPSLSIKIVEVIGKKLLNAEKRYEAICVKDARTRIIDFLKYNAANFGRKIGVEMLIKHSLTQQDIANFTGTSRQTVTSVLNDLKKTNQIHLKRKTILIRDIANLN